MLRVLFASLALSALVLGDGEEKKEGCGCDEGEAVVTMGPGAEESMEPDAVEDPPAETDPNRPPEIVVGEWQPPALDAGDARRLEELRRRCAAAPEDAAARYDLADFLAAHRWLPQAEEEYLRCALLEKESIRPWEGLLRVYGDRTFAGGRAENDLIRRIILQQGGMIILESEVFGRATDWLPHEAERQRRIVKAHRALLDRRPDDVALRRELVRALVALCEWPAVAEEAERVLTQLPDDTAMRFELAEACRKAGRHDDAIAALEETLRRRPDHAPSCLRLARLLAVHRARESRERIVELEERGLFHLFVRSELAPVPMRPDAFALARTVAGPALASQLWDEAMRTRSQRENPFDEERRFERRWIYLTFPRSFHAERIATLRGLARRPDAAAVGIVIGLLWGLGGDERVPDPEWSGWAEQKEIVDEAIRAAEGQGAAYFDAADRFLRAADTPVRRSRAVRLLRALRDRRAAAPLLIALEWDVDEALPLGTAAALEEVGDPAAIDGLAAAARDVRRPVPRRREALEALASFPDPRSAETVSLLAKEEPFAMACAYGLYRLTGDAGRLGEFRRWLLEADQSEHAFELVSKCEGAKAEELLLFAFESCRETLRPRALAALKASFWTTARDRVFAIVEKECVGADVPVETLRILAEFDDARAAERLAALVETLSGEAWAIAARAFAGTGDARAVRYFNRIRVLSKDPGQRRLAEQLYETSARREAEKKRAAAGE